MDTGYHPHFTLHNPSLLGLPIDTGHLYTRPVRENPHFFEQSTLRNTPLFPFHGLRNSDTNEPNNSRDWLYNASHFHNAFSPVFNSAPGEKFPIFNFGQRKSPTTGTTPPERRFHVNLSGNKTTLIYSSGADTPVRSRPSLEPNFPTSHNLTKEEELRVISNPLGSSTNGENVEEDEMHEDTEELDALLCSDDDLSEDDDEETSTGRSPSTMTDNGARGLVEDIGEEVDSFVRPTKRHKISDVGYTNLANSSKVSAEEDAESVCDDVNYKRCKRLRTEKVHETLRTLRSLIPDANGKDAIALVDEAIRYLRSLKVEMMALRLDAR